MIRARWALWVKLAADVGMRESLHPGALPMTMRRYFTLFAAVLAAATLLQAQQPGGEHAQKVQPTFKEHQIGESAQEFFSIAKMTEKRGMLSTDYCRSYLSDPKVMKAIEKARKKGGANDSSLAVLIDVPGCNSIQAALAGRDAEVELRFAEEFGSGSAQFIAGHLASVTFVVRAAFNDVVEDMSTKLNSEPQLDTETFQNTIGAIAKRRRAMWTLPNIGVKVSEMHSLEGNIIGTEVSVADPAMMKRRPNSLN